MTERTELINIRGSRPRRIVSNDLGITPQMLGAIERGDRTPSLTLAKKIADYYGVPMDNIFFEDSGNKMCLTGTEGG